MSQAWDPWILQIWTFGGNSSHSTLVQCAENPESFMARILGISRIMFLHVFAPKISKVSHYWTTFKSQELTAFEEAVSCSQFWIAGPPHISPNLPRQHLEVDCCKILVAALPFGPTALVTPQLP